MTQGYPVTRLTEDQGLVLFFCSFLVLRSWDSVTPLKEIRDYEIHDEKVLFAA